VIVASQTTKYLCFVRVKAGCVFSHKLVVFAYDSFSAIAVLQSRVHELWALTFGSSMKDDPVYTPSDCFRTFPFPVGFESCAALCAEGEKYHSFRATLMMKQNEGLTDTYNRFHDPNESAPDILKLRELHAAMDRAVLDAYGWTDIRPAFEFHLEYADEKDEENSMPLRRKKPWRYRWPEEVHDEVLARLLELNRLRAQAEQLSGAAAEAESKSRTNRKPRKAKKNLSIGTGSLLDSLPEEGQS
jgi:hypothetical protein